MKSNHTKSKKATVLSLLTVVTLSVFGCVHTVHSDEEIVQEKTLRIVRAEATTEVANAIMKASQTVTEVSARPYMDFDLNKLSIIGGDATNGSTQEIGEQPEDPGTGEDHPAEHEADSGSGSEAGISTEEDFGGNDYVSGDSGQTEEYWESQGEVEEAYVEDLDTESGWTDGVDGDGERDYGEPWADPGIEDAAEAYDTAGQDSEGSGAGDGETETGEYSDSDPGPDAGTVEADGADGYDEPEYVEADPVIAEDYVEETVAEESYTPSYEYLGQYRITFYDWCAECNGVAYQPTASGSDPIPWATCAAGYDLPFGTQLYVEGVGTFVVTDRGVGSGCLDIFVNTHQEALDWGLFYADVYIVY